MQPLTLTNLSLQRGERRLAVGVGFTLAAGQALRILGDNGTGKTTLLATLVGLLPVRAGTQQGFAALHTIYIGHKLSLYADLHVLDNLLYFTRLDAAAKDRQATQDDEQAVLLALQEVGLSEHIWQRASRLSAGQKRRVLLARLWLDAQQADCSGKLWVLDEPLTALDKSFVVRFEVLVRRFLAQGGRVVFTSHQPFFAQAFTQSASYQALDLSDFAVVEQHEVAQAHTADSDDSDDSDEKVA